MNNDSHVTIVDVLYTIPSLATSTVSNDTFINDTALSDKKKGKMMKCIQMDDGQRMMNMMY